LRKGNLEGRSDAAISADRDAANADAAMAMRATFAHDSRGVRALFDALVELLTGSWH